MEEQRQQQQQEPRDVEEDGGDEGGVACGMSPTDREGRRGAVSVEEPD